jgi:putative selenate reductase
MALGDKDEKGRRRPVATDKTFTAKVDTVVTAAGEKVDYDLLHKIGLPLEPNGIVKVNDKTCETELPDIFLIGDAQSGPSSIVAAIGGARKAADTILAREKKSYKDYAFISPTGFEEIYARKAHIPLRLVGANKVEEFAKQEAKRCLECSYICSKCTDVCPNRANLSLPIPGFRDPFQIIHIDAYCNECGNCGQFCPWDDRPYKDKVTIFNLQKDFDNSTNPGFLINGDNAIVRLNGKTHTLKLEEGQLKNAPSELNDISRIIHFIHKEHSYLLGAVEE